MFEIYAFCREVDDIADEPGDRATRLARSWRNGARDIDAIYAGRAAAALARPRRARCAQFGLAREDFLAVIDGMEMDVGADIRAPDLATLDLYCDRVASAVGRLSVRIFGIDAEGRTRARPSSRPRAAAHQHPARPRRGRRDRPALSAARGAATTPASRATEPHDVLRASGARRACCAVVAARARAISPTPTRSWRAAPRRACARRASWRDAYARILDALIARGLAAPRARVSSAKRALAVDRRCATR